MTTQRNSQTLSSDVPLSPTGKLRSDLQEPQLRQGWKIGRRKARWAVWVDPRTWLAIVAAVGVLAGGAIVMKQQVTPVATPAEKKPAPIAQTSTDEQIQAGVDRVYKITGTHWASKDEATLARVDALLVDKDLKGLESLQKSGEITQLKSGQTAHWLGSSGYLGARVQLRLTDSKTVLWTSREALR